MYNIHNYLAEEKRIINVTLEGILEMVSGNDAVEVLPQTHKSLMRIIEEPFYVGTNFKQVNKNKGSRFVLVSAPGATGKSAFGKYLAFKRNALYWNLADDLIIGDGTFHGNLYKALGPSRISEYALKLQQSKATLVIDAFDEAEIISGRRNVETFVREANDFLENAEASSIVLLSRTETAQNIAALFKANSIPYAHFEIDYFPESKAKEFVLKLASKRKAITPAVNKSVDDYFARIRGVVQDQESVSRFIGYAPVLEAIAAHVTEITNTAKLLSELGEGNGEVSLIDTIMNNLLERENVKFTSAFRERVKEEADRIPDWSSLYSKEEQLIRLLNYILFEEINLDDYPEYCIPDHLLDDYLETIRLFLPQHPFIQNSFEDKTQTVLDFAGPAFRDYSLAYIMLRERFAASAELYYQRESATARFPSQLFWDHYICFNDQKINSQHFLYLLEAYRARTTIGNETFLDVAQDEEGTHATFRIISGKSVLDEVDLDVDIHTNGFVFDNLKNASIDVDDTVVIGNTDNVYIIDSSIYCNQLIVKAKTLSVAAYSPNATTLCCTTAMRAPISTSLNISVSGDGNISVDIPNIFEYPKLTKFRKDLSTSDGLNVYVFVHHLRKIFFCFRTHKKDMPARDAEKIDYVIIADNPLKKSIFQFLIDQGIVFREAHLYKVNLGRMSEAGISWGALTSTNVNQLEKVHQRFIEWETIH